MKIPRKQILGRFLYTVLYLIIFEILKAIIQLTVLFQYIYLLLTQQYSAPLRNFTNKLSTYTYRVMRYMTLNENYRPFPFNDFPSEGEPQDEFVNFD